MSIVHSMRKGLKRLGYQAIAYLYLGVLLDELAIMVKELLVHPAHQPHVVDDAQPILHI
jgi:hypothetical protein